MRIVFGLLVLIGLVAGGVALYTKYAAAEAPVSFRTATVKRGDLLSTIGATGTVEPEEVVDVGAQVVGTIKELGVDLEKLRTLDPNADPTAPPSAAPRIDYGSVVKEGTVLAKIDPAVYEAQREQAMAAVERAQADLKQVVAKRAQTKAEWDRAQSLRNVDLKDAAGNPITGLGGTTIKAIADTDYILARANFEVAEANVGVSEAAIQQAKAALKQAETNLGYTVIKSPVEGVIVDRRVNIGQTVVASLNAPSLFLIAKDLRKMQVWASVNEADIGRILSRKEMPVRFTVDAYPGEVFHGKVAQVRLNATMTQNVVTYTVVVAFDNSNRKLLPYLTANLQFEVDQRKGVLTVPNGALRWKPRLEQVVPELRDEVAPLLASRAAREGASPGGKGGPPGKAPGEGRWPKKNADSKAASPAVPGPQAATVSPQTADQKTEEASAASSPNGVKEREERGRLWLQEGDFVRPIEVQLGATDGTMTEVTGKELSEGMELVLGEARPQGPASDGDTTNPFAPKMFRGKKPQ